MTCRKGELVACDILGQGIAARGHKRRSEPRALLIPVMVEA
jgi:hypothetical protein